MKQLDLVIKCGYCGATIFPSEKYTTLSKLSKEINNLVCPVCGHKITKIRISKIKLTSINKKRYGE